MGLIEDIFSCANIGSTENGLDVAVRTVEASRSNRGWVADEHRDGTFIEHSFGVSTGPQCRFPAVFGRSAGELVISVDYTYKVI
jgi:hypothetical protein